MCRCSHPQGGKRCRIFLSFAHLIVSFHHDLGGKPYKNFTFSPVECVAVLMPKGGSPAQFSSFSHLTVSFPHDIGGKPCKKFTFSPVECVAVLIPKGGNAAEFFCLLPI